MEVAKSISIQMALRQRAETAAMLFWTLLASGQIVMRKVNGWETLAEKPSAQTQPDPAQTKRSQIR